MRNPNLRGDSIRSSVVLTLAVILALTLAVPAQGADLGSGSADRSRSAARAKPVATLNAVGARFVGAQIPITGQVRRARGKNKLVLQGSVGRNRWSSLSTLRVRNGAYRFTPQVRRSPGTVAYRTMLYKGRRLVAVSNMLTVRVVARQPRATCASAPSPTTCPKPRSVPELRTIADAPYCPQLTVTSHNQSRSIGWRWDTAARRWVADPTPWVTVSDSKRAASAAECVKIVPDVPAGAVLPDLRIKDLTRCGLGDLTATNGTCFKIDPIDPLVPGDKKLLKFGVVTLNVGRGNGEVIADRSAAAATDWRAYQSFYDANGVLLGSVVDTGVVFYFAGDGHDHWHVRDFDEYRLIPASGPPAVRLAEKHGYCMQDNTSYGPMAGQPGVSPVPVYAEATSCGKGLPNALSIVHGLSAGWGDTYPTTLPDQAIDITNLADGVYTVEVEADAVGAVREINEANNTAAVQVQITGDTVAVLPGTSTGGLS